METLIDRYREQILGVLECFDRVVIQGTLPGLCFAQGMTSYLYAHNIRIFDYVRFAEPLRDQLRENAERLANENGLQIEFLRNNNIRKEEHVQKILRRRGHHPGLVCMLSALETCSSYQPWHDKTTGKTFLKPDSGKCLHYYFYFIDEQLGLCFVRVPTWCPFQLQIYYNGHNWLASKLAQEGISYSLRDNAFIHIDDWKKAQFLAKYLKVKDLHQLLDGFARRYCPVIDQLGVTYHWSLKQVEYATDIVFKHPQDLQAIYDTLTRTAVLSVKPEHVATFLGRKLAGTYQGELGNDFNTRIQGTRVKHYMGSATIKMYDKFRQVLRIETTVNDVSFFKHYRQVEHRQGKPSQKWAAMKKTIYSLVPLRLLLSAANHRYLQFISTLDDSSTGLHNLNKVSKTVVDQDRSYRGFNFFDDDDELLFRTIARGEFNISGFQNKHLRRHLPGYSMPRMCRILKRLRVHGLIKKIGLTYKYYLTRLGRQVVAAGLKLKQLYLIPQLAAVQSPA
jgi:hypothetical protein